MSAPWQNNLICSSTTASHFAIADLDGDQQPDCATVQAWGATASVARYSIQFDLSGGSGQLISVIAPIGGLRIVPQDVNGDSIPDLVVSTQWLNRPVAILLNDGRGKFTFADLAAFPVSIWGSHFNWNLAPSRTKEAAALLVSQNLKGKLGVARGLFLLTESSDQPSIENLQFSVSQATLRLFGRAPPCYFRSL